MLNINLDSETPSYVLINLFLDTMRKFGRKKVVKSMSYDCKDGLTVTDSDGVVWNLEVNAKVKIPDELLEFRVKDSDAKSFCPKCNCGMKEERTICSVCEYLAKI